MKNNIEFYESWEIIEIFKFQVVTELVELITAELEWW